MNNFRLATLLTSIALAACSGAADPEGSSDTGGNGGGTTDATTSSATTTDTSTDTAPDKVPLYLGLTVHLEGWPLDQQDVFEKYAANVRDYSKLARDYGLHFTWEARNLIAPSKTFGDNILLELQQAGDGVGVHADAGGNPKTTELGQLTAEIAGVKKDLEALGVKVRHVSGICSHLDWVTAAIDAGYEATNGVVDYCLKSLPLASQPPHVQACTNPSECHDVYPNDAQTRMHPWRMSDGGTWTTPDAEGELLLLHSGGEIKCIAEHASGEQSPTHCDFDQADVDEIKAQIDDSIAMVDADKMNQLHFVWSMGKAVDKDLLAQVFAYAKSKVDAGDVVWATVPELIDYSAN